MKKFSPNFYSLSLCLAAFLGLFYAIDTNGQGCIAVRHMGMCTATDSSGFLNKGQFQLTLGYRFLHSYKHFKGTEEQEERVEQHTEVINRTTSMDITLSYAVNRKLVLNATMPLVYSDRSSLYEHDRKNRFNTKAYGIGDMRLTATYWILDPMKSMKRNVSIGGGLKLPTGNENTTDVFYTVNGPQERPVDQSIQPGDGGWGVNVEFQAYTHIAHRLYAYANGFYLFNPMNTNGVRTYRDSLNPILANEAIMSITDQFMVRGGLSFYPMNNNKLNITLGARVEGVPVKDAFGKSDGFRRPGFIVSIEPGVTYKIKQKHEVNVSVPAALYRNRLQSLTDKETQALTGNPRHGDAAFADYLLLITYAYKF
jgi:hypothetical protein